MTVQYRKIFVLYFARSLYSIIEDKLTERCYKFSYILWFLFSMRQGNISLKFIDLVPF